MHPPAASSGPRYLRTPDAAKLLGLSPRTLEKHRSFGTGPVFRRLGGRVVYAVDDLQAWVGRGEKSSTSDDTGDTVNDQKAAQRTTELVTNAGPTWRRAWARESSLPAPARRRFR